MDFYTNPASSNCRKVDAVAKQLGIDLTHKVVDLRNGEHRKPEFLALNPNGKVPTLVDGDVVLWESNAIACYLASKTENNLWPKSDIRYDIMRWQSWELAHFGPPTRTLTLERVIKPLLGGETNADACQAAEIEFAQFAAVLDKHLEGRRFLVGDGLTVADICVASCLTYAPAAKFPLEPYPRIRAWFSSLDEQPGWRASAPPAM